MMMPAGQKSAASPAQGPALTRVKRREADAASDKERHMALYWVAAAAILLLDSMTTYLTRNLTGSGFPYSMLVLLVFILRRLPQQQPLGGRASRCKAGTYPLEEHRLHESCRT